MKSYRLISFSLLLCVVFPLMSNAGQLENAITALKNKDYKKAYAVLQPLAEQGNAEAQTRLGVLYVNGQGVGKDVAKGLSWIMKAANQGDETARRVAFRVYLDLVDQSDTAILFNLGYMCLNGWGGEHGANTCIGWLENAGKIGHEQSLKLLAKIYAEGLYGIAPDEGKATYWSKLNAAFAAGLDGKWEGSIPMGADAPPLILTYYFETDGDRLKGRTVGYNGEKMRISNGKCDGNKFSFSVRSNFGGVKINYTGTFYGDMIKLAYTTKSSGRRAAGSRAAILPDTDGGDLPPVTLTAKRVE